MSVSSQITITKEKKLFSMRRSVLSIRMHRAVAGLSTVPSRIIHPKRTIRRSPFDSLIDDVLVYISMYFLDHRDHWALALVSRRCNANITPLLYSNISLVLEYTASQEKGRNRINNRAMVLGAQQCFRTTLRTLPHRNLYIRELSWYLDNKESRETFLTFIAPMRNIQRIHISTPYGSPPIPLAISSLQEVFLPNCVDVSLEGLTPPAFAQLLLHPSDLRRLVIDSPPCHSIPILAGISDTPTSFPHLQSLSLRFPGGRTLPGAEELRLLVAWRTVLAALSSRLQYVTLSSRITDPGCYAGYLRTQPSAQSLVTHVLPVFLEESWPCLRRLTLDGVDLAATGRDRGGMYRKLEDKVGDVVVNKTRNQSDFLWHNYFAYNPDFA